MKDFVGRDIRVNDNIVWPAQSGHRLHMCQGTVVKINPSSLAVRKTDIDALVSIRRVDNVVVLL